MINPLLQLMAIQLISGSNTTLEVSWVSRNIWRDWNQENGPETRPVSWSRISAAGTSWDQTENTFQDYKWPLMPFIDIPYNIEKWILSFSSLSSVVWFSTQENNTYIVKKSKRTKSNSKCIILFCKLFRPIMRKKNLVSRKTMRSFGQFLLLWKVRKIYRTFIL